jgi:hypothetical protein
MRDTRTNQRRWTRDHVCKTIQGKVEHGRGRVLRIRLCVREIVARLLTRAGEYCVPPTNSHPLVYRVLRVVSQVQVVERREGRQ